MAKITKIAPHLWFAKGAKEAVDFYVSVFPDSEICRITESPADTPSGPAGSVQMIDFNLAGQPFMAISAGPLDPFNHAISFVVNCTNQDEVDEYWNKLLAGGMAEQCGWLKDRFGVSWQVVPVQLSAMLADPNRKKAKRAMEAMLRMVKLDIGQLRNAFEGA